MSNSPATARLEARISPELHALLKRAVGNLRDGDILMAHLGIWSRKDPFWPTLDPLIAQLKAKGFCFATIPERPARAQATAGR